MQTSWYGGQPGAADAPPGYGYTPPAPPPDPSKPLLVTAARRMNAAQYARAAKLLGTGGRQTAGWLLFLLSAGFFVYLLYRFLIYPKDAAAYLFLGAVFLAFLLALAGLLRFSAARTKKASASLSCYMDSEPEMGVRRLYTDRAEALTSRGLQTVFFQQATLLFEDTDLLILASPENAVVWRAEDMTPYDAHRLLSCLTCVVNPAFYRRRGMFRPWLPAPLPLPPLEQEPPVWLTLDIREGTAGAFGDFAGETARSLWMPLVSLALLIAGEQAIDRKLSASLLADFLVYAGLIAAAMAALVLLVCGLLYLSGRGKEEPIRFLFTPDGLAVRQKQSVRFYDRRHIRIRANKRRVRLDTPDGPYFLPWAEVDKAGGRADLRRILGL